MYEHEDMSRIRSRFPSVYLFCMAAAKRAKQINDSIIDKSLSSRRMVIGKAMEELLDRRVRVNLSDETTVEIGSNENRVDSGDAGRGERTAGSPF